MIEVMIAVLVLFIVQAFLPPAIQYLGADGSFASPRRRRAWTARQAASGAGNGRSRAAGVG